jgi:hypothetical protein
LPDFLDQEFAVQASRVDQRGERRALFLDALRTLGDLLQVRVVDPDGLAVGDDELLEGLGVFPAEVTRRGHGDAPAGAFLLPAVGVEDLLGEPSIQALQALGERGEILAAAGMGGRRQEQGNAGTDSKHGMHGGCPSCGNAASLPSRR